MFNNLANLVFKADNYPTLARQIFTGGRHNVKQYRHHPSKQDDRGYMKAGVPVKNPKVAANIEMMFAKWQDGKRIRDAALNGPDGLRMIQKQPDPHSISSIKMRTGLSRKVIRGRRLVEAYIAEKKKMGIA